MNKLDYAKLFVSTGFRVVLSVLLLASLVFYVMQISKASVKGYDVSALEKQVHELQKENQRLEFEIAKNASMQSIQERLKGIQFVPSDKAEFASLKAPVIAQR